MKCRTLVRTSTAVTLALVLLAGCGDDGTDGTDEPTASATSDEPTQSPSEPASETPTETPSETPSETASEPPANATLTDRLLTEQELAGFNETWRWQAGRDFDSEPPKSLFTCQRFGILSIGAMEVVARTYEPITDDSGAEGSHLVAEFPDAETANRAYAVLQSWHKDCAARLKKFDRVKVGKAEPVDVGADTAEWHMLTYAPPGEDELGYFDAQGFTQVGNRIALVELKLLGQDYNYEAGKEPMVAALVAAADQLR